MPAGRRSCHCVWHGTSVLLNGLCNFRHSWQATRSSESRSRRSINLQRSRMLMSRKSCLGTSLRIALLVTERAAADSFGRREATRCPSSTGRSASRKGRASDSLQVGTKLRTSNHGFGCCSSNLGFHITEETAGRALYDSVNRSSVADGIIETIWVSFSKIIVELPHHK
jgi:hypothetical protein